MSPASSHKISPDLVISSWNLLTNPDTLVQACQSNAVVDSKKTKGKTIANFRVGSASGSEAVLSSAENSKASSNVGEQSAALAATCSSDQLDAEHSKYDTGDKITRQTRLSKSKKLETVNRVALSEDKMCNNDFNVKGDIVSHTKTRGTKRSFQCDECGRTFNKMWHLTEHTRTHTGECPFLCNVCGRKFSKESNLTRHTKTTHIGERPFKCEKCGKTFTQKRSLMEHKTTHTGERYHFRCDICDCKFSRKYTLSTHMKIHTDERTFQCDVCTHEFINERSLKRHKRTHTNERPFKCDVCGIDFNRKDNLKKHKRTHTSKLPFKGTECGKGFIKKSHLTNHAFSHSSPAPFECNACDARFRHKSSLDRHVYTHSEKQPYKADRKSRKISNKRCTTDRNPVQPVPDHKNEKSLESSHCDASLTSTTSNQHMKSKTHTMNSETEFTTPGDVSTIIQLPSVSNQPSTSDIHLNKSQNQEEYREYTETVALLNEFADTYPITPDPESCEQHNDFFDDLLLDQEMPEATFPDKQNADAGYLITQLHPVAGWPLTSGIHVNKSQHQEKHEEIAEGLDYNHLQTIPPPKPSWDSGCSPGDYNDDDFLCP